MVDTYVSGAYGAIRVGSSPIQDIIYLSEKSDKKYTVYGISQKLARNSMRYDELKFLAGVLGYNIKFEKQINE